MVVNSVGHELIEWTKYLKDLSPVFKVHFVRCGREITFWIGINQLVIIIANSIWVQKHLGFQINFSKKWLLCLLFCSGSSITLFQRMIILRSTTALKLLMHRFSTGCVGKFLQFWLSAPFDSISWTNFDMKLIVSFQS